MRIITEPDNRLHTPSKLVADINDDIRELMQSMLQVMYKHEGIGLAAVQVGVMKNVIVVDTDQLEHKPIAKKGKLQHNGKALLMANPRVVDFSSETKKYEEACLSYPGIFVEIERPDQVTVEYLDYDGKLQKITADGLLSICLQHEIDHTKGKVITDYVSTFKKTMLHKKVSKFIKENPSYGQDKVIDVN
jgi:peptide deformylase